MSNQNNESGFDGQNGSQPQQPNYQQPQQPQQPYYPPQPQVVVAAPATPAEQGASFGAGGSVFMLILCIVGTVNLLTGFIGKILSLDIGGLLLYVLEILIVVGMWITFANAKKKKLSATGIKLIRVPYIIQFVFAVLSFVLNLVIWFMTLNILSLVFGILTFIFQCICFASVNKTLGLALDINRNKSVFGRKAGIFAAVMMIIFASFRLIGDIVGYITIEAIKTALGDNFLAKLLGGGGIMTIIVAVVAFLSSIAGAIVILQFNKKVKQAHGE